ncbi:hypothetical protein D3C84_159010 [compost metagenome]
MGGIQSTLDVFGTGAGEFTDHRGIDRTGVGEIRAIDRSNEFATDKVSVALLEIDNRAWSTGFSVNHDDDLCCFVGACPRSAEQVMVRY